MVADKFPAMWGSATEAMEVSSTSMKVGTITASAMSHGFALGRHCWSGINRECGLGTAGGLGPNGAAHRYFLLWRVRAVAGQPANVLGRSKSVLGDRKST